MRQLPRREEFRSADANRNGGDACEQAEQCDAIDLGKSQVDEGVYRVRAQRIQRDRYGAMWLDRQSNDVFFKFTTPDGQRRDWAVEHLIFV